MSDLLSYKFLKRVYTCLLQSFFRCDFGLSTIGHNIGLGIDELIILGENDDNRYCDKVE